RKPFICNFHCIKTCNFVDAPYCIAQALLNAARGNLDEGFVFVGKYGYKIDKITSVKEVINNLFQDIEGGMIFSSYLYVNINCIVLLMGGGTFSCNISCRPSPL
ncbi:MAG: hypothetical protein WAO60_06135, partial [Defluviitoga tunisiensis]